jgi:hypothetical protein
LPGGYAFQATGIEAGQRVLLIIKGFVTLDKQLLEQLPAGAS